jgi:hypothetical protein
MVLVINNFVSCPQQSSPQLLPMSNFSPPNRESEIGRMEKNQIEQCYG